MPIFVSSRLNGLTQDAARGLTLLEQDYATVDDYESLRALRGLLVADLAHAVEMRDAERVDYLDELYDEISAICDELAYRFPERALLDEIGD